MPDFSLLQMPNFAQAALGGYKAGQAIGQQNRVDAALGNADLTRPETLLPVLRADPSTGAALLTASSQLAKAHADAASRTALANVILGSRSGGGDPSASAPSAPTPAAVGVAANMMAPPATSAPTGSPTDPVTGDVVVTAQKPQTGGWSDAERAAIMADPHAFLTAQNGLAKLNETHQAAVADAANAQASIAMEASKLPYDQRKAFIQAQSPYLRSHGVDQAAIDAFDPTDANVSVLQTQALGVKDALARQDKDRSFALDTARFDETKRSNRVSEGQAAQRIGLEGANVAISRGNLAISQHREARESAKGTSGSGVPTGIAAPTSRAAYAALASGTRFRAPDGSIRIKP